MPNRPSAEVLIARRALAIINKAHPAHVSGLMAGKYDWSTPMIIATQVVALTLELSDRKPRVEVAE